MEIDAIVQSIDIGVKAPKIKVKFVKAIDGSEHRDGYVQCSRQIRLDNPVGTYFRGNVTWYPDKKYYRAKKVKGIDLVVISEEEAKKLMGLK